MDGTVNVSAVHVEHTGSVAGHDPDGKRVTNVWNVLGQLARREEKSPERQRNLRGDSGTKRGGVLQRGLSEGAFSAS